MAAIDRNPEELDMLSPLNFDFFIHNTTNTNYYVQKAKLPGLTIPPAFQPNPFVTIPHSGDHIQFDEFVIEFKVDEKMKNYLEIFGWLNGLGFPDKFEEYSSLTNKQLPVTNGIKADITVLVQDAARNPMLNYNFRDAFPTALSGFTMDTTSDNVVYVTATASFKYTSYKITPVV